MANSMSSSHVLGLTDCTSDCTDLVGGKAVGLGALLRQGLHVPPGFAITSRAYREHVRHNNLTGELSRLLLETSSYDAQLHAAEQIRKLFESSTPAPEVENEIRRAYEELCRDPRLPVAVRSSATIEDTAQASFAGQQETYLFIVGADAVLEHVLRCWSSLFTPQAIAYRAHLRTDVTDLAMGVVVQRMVPAEAAGVMMTLDPITGDRSGIMIEAAYGLGAAVVNGEVDPDRFVIDKASLQIRSRSTGMKKLAYRFDPVGQGTRAEEVPPAIQGKPCVTDAEVTELARAGKRMEEAMGLPQDIEWAIGPGDGGEREMFLLQARPETIWSQKSSVA
jgi:pyruvate,water dikinase